jgi:hypothetical protein
MYLAAVILLMLVLPAVSVALEALRTPGGADLMALIGKWFTFWAVGARLFLAGVTQSLRPKFTAQSIFDIKDQGALAIVREVGFGNLAIGALGLASLIKPHWVAPAAIAGGLYYGLAGLGHLFRPNRSFKEQTALVSDLAIFVLLAVFIASRAV